MGEKMDLYLLEQLLNLPQVRVSRYQFLNDEVIIWVYIPEGQHRCPKCGRYHHHVTEQVEVKVRDLSVFGKKCYLIIQKGRLHCSCSYRGYEAIDFVDKYQRQTTRFTEFLFQLCDRMTIMNAAELAEVDWKRAYKTDRQTLSSMEASTSLPKMTAIGIDEIAFEKRHRYFTIVYDLSHDNGVLFAVEGRKKESVNVFFDHLSPQQLEDIKIVCMDMWDPYIASVREKVPHADIVFDRFHIQKHLHDCIDIVRRSIARDITDKHIRLYIKNNRWVLYKNLECYTKDDHNTLLKLKQINEPLYEAYLVKEQFDRFFDYKKPAWAKKFLKKWYQHIPTHLKVFFQPFYDMLIKYLRGVLSYIKHRISNAKAEGLNHKIKVLKRMAYGYRDKDYFKLKILRRCGYLKQVNPVF